MKSFLLLPFALGLLSACNSNSFSGGAYNQTPANSGGSPQGGTLDTQKNGPGDDTKSGDDANGQDPGVQEGAAGDPETGINKKCLSKKASDYNIAVAIDASLSGLRTDPQNLRGQAVIKFANNLEAFAKSSSGRSVQLAVVGFAANARPGQNGAIDLARDSAAKIVADVQALTTFGGIGTNYEAALSGAEAALRAMGAVKGQSNQRNFVIFLSDGEPNRGSSGFGRDPAELATGINASITNLVTSLDVAMITIATGSDIQEQGIDIIKQMAQPSDKGSIPDHKGQYIRADSDEDLDSLAKQLGQAVSKCS